MRRSRFKFYFSRELAQVVGAGEDQQIVEGSKEPCAICAKTSLLHSYVIENNQSIITIME